MYCKKRLFIIFMFFLYFGFLRMVMYEGETCFSGGIRFSFVPVNYSFGYPLSLIMLLR